MASESVAKCAHCGNLAADRCTKCKSQTYCGKACQIKDWPKHKPTCKDIVLSKTLARAAQITQEAFFNFSEQTWDTPIIKIEDRGDVLFIYDGDQAQEKGYFVPFPHHLMKDDRTKMAVHSIWKCNEPLAWMHDLLVELLRGLRIRIEEPRMWLGTVPMRVTVIGEGFRQDNWPDGTNTLLQITSLQTQKQWILDFTGPQYGIYQVLWERSMYETRFKTKISNLYPFGTSKTLAGILANVPGDPTFTYGVVGEAAHRLDEAVTAWTNDSSVSLAALLSLDNEAYDRISGTLLGAMDDAVKSFMMTSDFSAPFKACQKHRRNFPGKSEAEVSRITASFLRKVADTYAKRIHMHAISA